MDRRRFFLGSTVALASTSMLLSMRSRAWASPWQPSGAMPAPLHAFASCLSIEPIKAQTDRIIAVHACTRPFRHAGPRIEAEVLGQKVVVHNYGHGGAGWSLSWGSSTQAVRLAQAASAGRQPLGRLGVIGCGPLGLTSALVAQRAGWSVCIYAKALPPNVSSMGATGIWSPDSRFCALQHEAQWAVRWREMVNISFDEYRNTLGLSDCPVEWINGYKLSNTPFDAEEKSTQTKDPTEPEYAQFTSSFMPPQVDLPPGSHPFPAPYARGWSSLMFNLTPYATRLMREFLAAGGKVEMREFSQPNQLLGLPEAVFINATGYGAKALFNDSSIIAVRGQTIQLTPQPEMTYGLRANDFFVMPRRDGLLMQNMNDIGNFNNTNDRPDRADAEAVVGQVAAFVAGMRC